EPLPGPGGVGHLPAGVEGDGVAGDVDFAGVLPVPPDGGVVQPRVVGGHPRRVVIEDFLHDVLGNVPVDQPGAQGMAPVVRGNSTGMPAGHWSRLRCSLAVMRAWSSSSMGTSAWRFILWL